MKSDLLFWVLTGAIATTSLAAVQAVSHADGAVIHGLATSIVDGDTLDVGGTRIRLWGIDAPEMKQTCDGRKGEVYECGRDAKAQLADLTRGHELTCTPINRDQYNRLVAKCAATGADIGETMIRYGWAVDYTQYSGGAYKPQEQDAQRNRRGMWSGRFDLPADFRTRKRQKR